MTTKTADLSDELGEEVQSLSLHLHNFGGRSAFEGPIRTVRCFEDNTLMRTTVSSPGDGHVLVVDGGGSLEKALLGDMIAEIASANGWVGIVINGAIRDRVELRSIDLGVKALGSTPRKSEKTGAGELDVVLEFGGATFRPGANLYSDDDGILVEP